MQEEIHQYYDQLAADYDENRFGNSYGQFIDWQERRVLDRLIGERRGQQVLDMGCGTGRLLDYATHGVDLSKNMIAEAAKKYPQKQLQVAGAADTGLAAGSFDLVYSFHVIMHLDRESTQKMLAEAMRLLKPGGRFIFDVPSKKRRQLTRYQAKGWHGANSYSMEEIKTLAAPDWQIRSHQGILFFPLHQFPAPIRRPLLYPDLLLGRSPFREYASYLVIELVKP